MDVEKEASPKLKKEVKQSYHINLKAKTDTAEKFSVNSIFQEAIKSGIST